jgi:hypothetical protein
MTWLATFDQVWINLFAAASLLAGLGLVWRGLAGGRGGACGLLRRGTPMLGRIEGFRVMILGLVLIGVGLAVFWRAQWLLVLALGIGFVEIRESSMLIAVWRRNPPEVAHGVRSC